MAYQYTLNEFCRVRAEKTYPWPCASAPGRTIELYPSDVLTMDANGDVRTQTGLMMFGIKVPKEDLEFFSEPITLQVG